jgi:hypothetical protein
MNILTLIEESFENNQNPNQDILRLHSLNLKEREQYLRRIQNDRGLKASFSLRNLLMEIERRELTDSEIETIFSLRDDIDDRKILNRTLPVFTIPPEMKSRIPSSVVTEHISTDQALDKLFMITEKRIILVTAFASPGITDVLGPLIANATLMKKNVLFVTQPESNEYNPHPVIEELGTYVGRHGDPIRFTVRLVNMNAEGMMHLKIFVADRKAALVGSANLTRCAMSRNIESGVLVFGHTARIISLTVESMMDLNDEFIDSQ